MDSRILDLDGSVIGQTELVRQTSAVVCPMHDWGPHLRLACSFGRYRSFERDLAEMLGTAFDRTPVVTFIGSGDFHHVTLALMHRLRQPFNLLMLDNHPDWVRGVPLMHCGTWLNHAARLPLVRNVFHVGGDVDFDNAYRWLAPWDLLLGGRIHVLPAVRRYRRGRWRELEHEPLRLEGRVTAERMEEMLRPHRDELERWPLYITVDKDVLRTDDAIVNWDSGHLELAEATTILDAFRNAAGDDLAGMDLVGDWSRVEVSGPLRRLLHWTEHPALTVDAEQARLRNEETNLALLAAAGAASRAAPAWHAEHALQDGPSL